MVGRSPAGIESVDGGSLDLLISRVLSIWPPRARARSSGDVAIHGDARAVVAELAAPPATATGRLALRVDPEAAPLVDTTLI